MKIKLVHRNSLSCETIVRKAPDGHLFLASQCCGNWEPEPENKVYVFHSYDNGDTWSKPINLIDNPKRAYYLTEVSVFDNHIDIFVVEHDGYFLYPEVYFMRSYDNGYTFTRVDQSVFDKNSFVFFRGFTKENDEILYSYQYYPATKEDSDRLSKENKYMFNSGCENVLCGIIKTKDGINYEKGDDVYINNYPVWQWAEPTFARLSNGDVVMLYRINGAGYLYKTISTDNGKTWSELEITDIPNPNNKPRLIKTNDGRIIILNTPNNKPGMINRNPLEVWVSNDDMKTWYKKIKVLEFPSSYLSYPDGFYDEETNSVKFAFELNRHDVYYVEVEI